MNHMEVKHTTQPTMRADNIAVKMPTRFAYQPSRFFYHKETHARAFSALIAPFLETSSKKMYRRMKNWHNFNIDGMKTAEFHHGYFMVFSISPVVVIIFVCSRLFIRTVFKIQTRLFT